MLVVRFLTSECKLISFLIEASLPVLSASQLSFDPSPPPPPSHRFCFMHIVLGRFDSFPPPFANGKFFLSTHFWTALFPSVLCTCPRITSPPPGSPPPFFFFLLRRSMPCSGGTVLRTRFGPTDFSVLISDSFYVSAFLIRHDPPRLQSFLQLWPRTSLFVQIGHSLASWEHFFWIFFLLVPLVACVVPNSPSYPPSPPHFFPKGNWFTTSGALYIS